MQGILVTLPENRNGKTCKGMILYCAEFIPKDNSNRFTLHPWANMFLSTPSQHLLEASSHVFLIISVLIAMHPFTQLSATGHC